MALEGPLGHHGVTLNLSSEWPFRVRPLSLGCTWQAQVLTQRHKPPSILVEPMLVIEAMCVLCTHDSILHAVALSLDQVRSATGCAPPEVAMRFTRPELWQTPLNRTVANATASHAGDAVIGNSDWPLGLATQSLSMPLRTRAAVLAHRIPLVQTAQARGHSLTRQVHAPRRHASPSPVP